MAHRHIDYDDWVEPAALAEKLGGTEALNEAIARGAAELYTVDGLELGRRIWTRERPRGARWMSYAEAVAEIGITIRAIEYRVQRGQMDRRLTSAGDGSVYWEVRIKR